MLRGCFACDNIDSVNARDGQDPLAGGIANPKLVPVLRLADYIHASLVVIDRERSVR
jgi:hypothetical protein